MIEDYKRWYNGLTKDQQLAFDVGMVLSGFTLFWGTIIAYDRAHRPPARPQEAATMQPTWQDVIDQTMQSGGDGGGTAGEDGRRVTQRSSFHLRPSDTPHSTGYQYQSGTVVTLVHQGTASRGGHTIWFVRLDDGRSGWTFVPEVG